jgi:hypothetical protein
MPVLALKIGSRWPNRPESWVDVVEAATMDFCWALAAPANPMPTANAMVRATAAVRALAPEFPAIREIIREFCEFGTIWTIPRANSFIIPSRYGKFPGDPNSEFVLPEQGNGSAGTANNRDFGTPLMVCGDSANAHPSLSS